MGERIEVTGVVQGVGFRPFVHRLANELGLRGFVGNDSTQVFIEVTGSPAVLDRFVRRLVDEAPPLAHIVRVVRSECAPHPDAGFRVVASRREAGERTHVPSDAALCADCRRELLDPLNRRYRHPFINCTNCGPRFTIIRSLPYDRENTTMHGFDLCHDCAREYHDPTDRRYHAQPICCPACGPVLRATAGPATLADPIGTAVEALRAGSIVAVKGLGGYHLVADATSQAAVENLRRRKHRPDKPFAVLVPGVDRAQRLANLSDAELAALESRSAPIVLVRRHATTELAPLVAPGNPLVGLLLPYTPLHVLLMTELDGPAVVTSANAGGGTIAYTDAMIGSLRHLYDMLLDHDRPIHQPCDDSVVRVIDGRLMPIRRARGYAPTPVNLPRAERQVLAVGAELKNTFCVASGEHAWVSQHIGDLAHLDTLQTFGDTVDRFLNFYDVTPTVVAADAHPGYLSTQWARSNHSDACLEVQHHHAHVAAIMAEHQLDPTQLVLGVAFDGTGFGSDGTVWGGEFIVATATGFKRIAHLEPIALPGGDAAIQHPCRVALAHLHAAGLEWASDLAPVRAVAVDDRRRFAAQLERGVACVPTTSMGRLFDAVASLLDLRHSITYEAQAAIELEIAASEARSRHLGYTLPTSEAPTGTTVVGVAPLLHAVVSDLREGHAVAEIAWAFHEAVAHLVAEQAVRIADSLSISTVALCGGVFQNVLLTQRCQSLLASTRLEVLTASLVPPNDGGIALGQAYIAAQRSVPGRFAGPPRVSPQGR